MDQPRTAALADPAFPPPVAGQQEEKPAPNLPPLAARLRLLRQAEARQERIDNRDHTRARKLDTRAKIIIGGALMAEARTDPSFATTVLAILERRVVDARDRHSIGLGRNRGLDRLLAVSQRSAMALEPSTPEPSNEGGPAMSRKPDEHAEALAACRT